MAEAFDAQARSYDRMYHSKIDRAEDAVVAKTINGVVTGTNLRVLDLGCGTGSAVDLLHGARGVQEYYGIDVSEEMVCVATEKWNFPPFIWRVGSILEGAFAFRWYDVVLSLFGSFGYVPYKEGLEVVYDSLAHGGRMVVMPWTKLRLERERPIPAVEAAHFVTVEQAWQEAHEVGFTHLRVRGLSARWLDRLGWLPYDILEPLMFTWTSCTRGEDSIYLIVEGVKP